jgi:hypothetical protein
VGVAGEDVGAEAGGDQRGQAEAAADLDDATAADQGRSLAEVGREGAAGRPQGAEVGDQAERLGVVDAAADLVAQGVDGGVEAGDDVELDDDAASQLADATHRVGEAAARKDRHGFGVGHRSKVRTTLPNCSRRSR